MCRVLTDHVMRKYWHLMLADDSPKKQQSFSLPWRARQRLWGRRSFGNSSGALSPRKLSPRKHRLGSTKPFSGWLLEVWSSSYYAVAIYRRFKPLLLLHHVSQTYLPAQSHIAHKLDACLHYEISESAITSVTHCKKSLYALCLVFAVVEGAVHKAVIESTPSLDTGLSMHVISC